MSQTVTLSLKLKPTKDQQRILKSMNQLYIQTINELVSEMVVERKTTKKTTRHLEVALPSAVKNQLIRDAKSVFQKAKKSNYKKIPVLKKPVCYWNNQNYEIKSNSVALPLMIDGVVRKTEIALDWSHLSDTQKEYLQHKLGTVRIVQKNKQWRAQFSITVPTTAKMGTEVMGVDLGIKVPAVAVTGSGKIKFFGNGRQNKYKKRKFKSHRRKLGKLKKLSAIKKLEDKEQRYMKDQDHKISRSIVNFAKENKISIIRLECLENIRESAKTSRKNNYTLHTWSFYRLSQFIEYKAKLAGIQVEYVNPAYTSQTCPQCGKLNHANDRHYVCSCGFRSHRDIVGAMNIRYATGIDGHSQSA